MAVTISERARLVLFGPSIWTRLESSERSAMLMLKLTNSLTLNGLRSKLQARISAVSIFTGVTFHLEPISHHTSIIKDDKMYLIGGSYNFNSNANVYSLDLRTFKCEMLRVRGAGGDLENIPAARDEHTAVIHGDTIILFGGFVDGERTNHIYKLYLNKNIWEKVELANA